MARPDSRHGWELNDFSQRCHLISCRWVPIASTTCWRFGFAQHRDALFDIFKDGRWAWSIYRACLQYGMTWVRTLWLAGRTLAGAKIGLWAFATCSILMYSKRALVRFRFTIRTAYCMSHRRDTPLLERRYDEFSSKIQSIIDMSWKS